MRPYLLALLAAGVACQTGAPAAHQRRAAHAPTAAETGPPALIYKTRADYHDRVPVLLSEDRQTVVAYPDPADVRLPGGTFPLPGTLHQGYLLDNRGISRNVAFLKLTYAEYAQLTAPPTLQALNELVLDRDPLVALCDCGTRHAFTNITEQVNQLIDANQLATKCKSLK